MDTNSKVVSSNQNVSCQVLAVTVTPLPLTSRLQQNLLKYKFSDTYLGREVERRMEGKRMIVLSLHIIKDKDLRTKLQKQKSMIQTKGVSKCCHLMCLFQIATCNTVHMLAWSQFTPDTGDNCPAGNYGFYPK